MKKAKRIDSEDLASLGRLTFTQKKDFHLKDGLDYPLKISSFSGLGSLLPDC